MATQLRKWDWSDHSRGGGKYDWDNWLNGKPWKLFQGKDFKRDVDSFRASIWAMAKRRGLSARVSKLDEKTLVVQAFELAAC